MKENTKLILVSIITIIISITGSAVANTMLQADSISYKTSNGDTTDVNSALDRLFDVADINGRLGNTDISSIGDGTITGAVSNLKNNLDNINQIITDDSSNVAIVYDIKAANAGTYTYTVQEDGIYLLFMESHNESTNVNNSIKHNNTIISATYGTFTRTSINAVNAIKGDTISFYFQANWSFTNYQFAKIIRLK